MHQLLLQKLEVNENFLNLYATYDIILSSNNMTYQKLSDLSMFLNDNSDRMTRVENIHKNCTKYST